MKKAKRARLEAAGWSLGSAKDFLGLTREEALFVEIKLALSESLRRRRVRRGLTQAEVARRIQSSQSRVAKMESGEESVSLDLLVRTLLALGATRAEVARIIAPRAA